MNKLLLKKTADSILKESLALERLVMEKEQINSLYNLLNSISSIDLPKKPSSFDFDKMKRQVTNLKSEAKSLNKLFYQF